MIKNQVSCTTIGSTQGGISASIISTKVDQTEIRREVESQRANESHQT